MSMKLKALVASAVAAITMSGAANALNNNEMFLVAYDATASKTFVAALGQAGSVSAFTGNTNLSVDYSADANWVNLMSTATAGSVTYQVLGLFASNLNNITGYNAGDKILVSSTAVPGTLKNTVFNTLVANAMTPTSTGGQFYTQSPTGTGTSLVLGTGFNSGATVNTNFFGQFLTVNTTGLLDTNLNFYSVTRPPTSATIGSAAESIKTQYLQGAAGSAADVWNLSSAGLLTYTATVAAVPEADTWAMMMLGLGFMGFVARRRA